MRWWPRWRRRLVLAARAAPEPDTQDMPAISFEEYVRRQLHEVGDAVIPDQGLDDLRAQLARRSLHPCPVTRCRREVPERLLMCAPHWRLVAPPIKRAVWDAWNDGRGRGSTALLHAQAAAIRCVNERTENA